MIRINYVTSSIYKEQEIKIFIDTFKLSDGILVKDLFSFHLYPNNIHERLEVDLSRMVSYEAKEAYSQIKIPCIVEHAGLIFENYQSIGYPGGLTKPMWNTLGQDFLSETNSAGKKVVARAVIGYCDGREIKTFIGETSGVFSDTPRGSREFYWDTIFIPDSKTNLTYAEIVEKNGIEGKLRYSQSVKALVSFLEYQRAGQTLDFWK